VIREEAKNEVEKERGMKIMKEVEREEGEEGDEHVEIETMKSSIEDSENHVTKYLQQSEGNTENTLENVGIPKIDEKKQENLQNQRNTRIEAKVQTAKAIEETPQIVEDKKNGGEKGKTTGKEDSDCNKMDSKSASKIAHDTKGMPKDRVPENLGRKGTKKILNIE
jgi:hypothetical protein